MIKYMSSEVLMKEHSQVGGASDGDVPYCKSHSRVMGNWDSKRSSMIMSCMESGDCEPSV